MKKKLQILSFLLLIGFISFAQNKTVTGTVTSKDDGAPVPGVTVRVSGAKNAVQTSVEGRFSIQVANEIKSLEFASIGFQTQTVSIVGKSNITVSLSTSSQNLSELVVVGYGSSKSLGTTVASVKRVDGDVIKDRPSANLVDALQGQVPGLQVYTSSGEPSATSSIRLHGSGSLGASSTPLILLDGIPTASGNLVSLNPNDIESVEVLKDAAATSIYGSRAANGVIAITTRRGSLNLAPSIDITSQYSISNLTKNTKDLYNNFMSSDELLKFRVASGAFTQTQADAIRATFVRNGELINTKWNDVYMKKDVPTYQNGISISGGGGKTTYHISASQYKQDGLAYRSMFERYTILSNINTKVNDWFDVGVKFQGSTDTRQLNPYTTNNANFGISSYILPWYTNLDVNGNEYPDLMTEANMYNPKYLAKKIVSTGRQILLNPTAYIQIKPLKGLTFKSQAGIDGYDYITEGGTYPSYIGSGGTGSWSQSFERGVSKTIYTTLEYRFNLGEDLKHRFAALAGHEYSDNTYEYQGGSVSGLVDDALMGLGNGTSDTRGVSTSKSEYAFNSFFGRLEYTYDNKYSFQGTLRQDESSRFGANNKKATFWSAGAKWDLKKESFLENVKAVSELSLKASTGTSGNASIGNYAHLATVSSSTSYSSPGYLIGSAGNPDLTWETQRKTTLGVKTELFGRVNLEVEAYKRVTTSMLMSVPQPYTTGFSSVQRNVGSLQNIGLDVDLSVTAYKNTEKGIYVTPFINFNFNRDKITELFDNKNYWIIAGTGVSWAVGKGVTYLYPMWAGVNSANGNPQWYVPNSGDGFIETKTDPSAVTSTFNSNALQQNTGIRRYAPLNGGFGFNAGYGNFTLTTNFSFSKGKYLINNDRYFYENPTAFPTRNSLKTVQDFWKNPGDVTTFPKAGIQFTQFDDRLIEDASFLRLKFIELGYSLPKSIMKETKFIKSATFSVGSRNLFTWTKYTGPDPEVDSNLSLGANPNTQQVVFGLKVGF